MSTGKKFKVSSKISRGWDISRTYANPGHSDFILTRKSTDQSYAVPQTSFHRYVNKGMTVSQIVKHRTGDGAGRIRVF